MGLGSSTGPAWTDMQPYNHDAAAPLVTLHAPHSSLTLHVLLPASAHYLHHSPPHLVIGPMPAPYPQVSPVDAAVQAAGRTGTLVLKGMRLDAVPPGALELGLQVCWGVAQGGCLGGAGMCETGLRGCGWAACVYQGVRMGCMCVPGGADGGSVC